MSRTPGTEDRSGLLPDASWGSREHVTKQCLLTVGAGKTEQSCSRHPRLPTSYDRKMASRCSNFDPFSPPPGNLPQNH
jgi:hypothetical protein